MQQQQQFNRKVAKSLVGRRGDKVQAMVTWPLLSLRGMDYCFQVWPIKQAFLLPHVIFLSVELKWYDIALKSLLPWSTSKSAV